MFVDDGLPRLTPTDSQSVSQSVAVAVVELAHKANNKTIIRKANIEQTIRQWPKTMTEMANGVRDERNAIV